jgi:hypothetical protein
MANIFGTMNEDWLGRIQGEGLKGIFAIVKMWPNLKAAEDECIARIKAAASALGLSCIEILEDGRILGSDRVLKRTDVDFAIHLHYSVPKSYDAFSFVALWNPVDFYHEWGYANCSRNLLTHEDFLSCSSTGADAHIGRLIRGTTSHLPPSLQLYHSCPGIAYPPSVGEGKLFYAGINWDVITGGQSRHGALLQLLDGSDALRIYGPHIFQGIQVWKGYRSYQRELPFDGTSVPKAIHEAGIALVLSSQAHKASELMSSRLFEGISAGAAIICDENPFAKRHFGDSLLYVDTREPVQDVAAQVLAHVESIRADPEQALERIRRSQRIFEERFSLVHSLRNIYESFHSRVRDIARFQSGQAERSLRVALAGLVTDWDEVVVEAMLDDFAAQDHDAIRCSLVIDAALPSERREQIASAAHRRGLSLELRTIRCFDRDARGNILHRRPLGSLLSEALDGVGDCDAVMFVGPQERMLSSHVSGLARLLQGQRDATSAVSAIRVYRADGSTLAGVLDRLGFTEFDPMLPPPLSRFLIRIASLPRDLPLSLPSLDHRAMAALVGNRPVHSPWNSLVQHHGSQPSIYRNPIRHAQEWAVLQATCPEALHQRTGRKVADPHAAIEATRSRKASVPPTIKRSLRSRAWWLAQWRQLRIEGVAARLRKARTRLREWTGQ